MLKRKLRLCFQTFLALLVTWGATGAVLAQESGVQARPSLTAADYAQAEKFLRANVTPLVLRAGVRPHWLPDERFWYRNTLVNEGSEFILVDPVRGKRQPAFDQAAVAAALSAATKKTYDPLHLPFALVQFSADLQTISFRSEGQSWSCDRQGRLLRKLEGREAILLERLDEEDFRFGLGERARFSPDGRWSTFLRDDNLWIRELATGKEKQLTFDGQKDFGYATDNAGWIKSNRPVVLWSPDSKKIATFQQDQREVGEMYLVETKVGHPALQAWKYPLPGDKTVTMIQRVIIHLDGPRTVRLKMAPDQHRSTFTDDIKLPNGDLGDVEWSPDSSQIAFVSSSRDHKQAILRLAQAETGEVRDIFEEKVDTYFESGNDLVNWRFLPGSQEVIWFSERDNWGQLYLYDLQTGRMKNKITPGEGNVIEILSVDQKGRTITFLAVGREKGRDPYFRHLYRVGFDGRNPRLLTPENADHDCSLSPSGRFFVDSYSKPDVPPVAVLRDAQGKLRLVLERADIAPLLAIGWKPPLPFTVKARDGGTDLYGLMFRPTNFDPTKKYPIVNNVYPGPQTGSVGSRSFLPARGDTQALAELGFIVIQLDGMGTPLRSKKFHETWYGNMGDNTLPDQVEGMKQLAQRYSWIDLDRAGIYGHSGGGNTACDAMFRYPDFFKVGVSQAGNHDNRIYEDDWGEKWQGLFVANPDGTTNYDNQANQLLAKNLKGKLLLAHGTMDNNVPPYSTLLVVNELIKANKDFDLILFPNRPHGFGNEAYMVRRRWDYFVRYLLGAEPPREYELKPSPPRR